MEERVGIYIKKINDAIEKYINNDLKKYNLTMSQARVLRYLHRNKEREVAQKELEEEFNITHATVSGIIARLETNGFVKVNRSKRSNLIVLLEKGKQNEKEIKQRQEEIEKLICKGFNKEEENSFVLMLRRVYENLLREEEFNG